MPILSRLFGQGNRLDSPVIASRREQRLATATIVLDVAYLSAREWIDLGVISKRGFDFSTLRAVQRYGPNHPWSWRITNQAERVAAARLCATGLVTTNDDLQSVQLSLEGFLRVVHGAWGHHHIGVIPLQSQQRS